jgi:hypothetical protein
MLYFADDFFKHPFLTTSSDDSKANVLFTNFARSLSVIIDMSAGLQYCLTWVGSPVVNNLFLEPGETISFITTTLTPEQFEFTMPVDGLASSHNVPVFPGTTVAATFAEMFEWNYQYKRGGFIGKIIFLGVNLIQFRLNIVSRKLLSCSERVRGSHRLEITFVRNF